MNNKEDNENINKFVASLDIKSLFPSLKSEQCGNVVCDMIRNSSIKLEGLNPKELGVFLRKHMSSEDISNKNLRHLVPDKIKKPKHYVKKKDTDEYELWYFPTEDPTQEDLKIMMAEVVSIAVKFVMNNPYICILVYFRTMPGACGDHFWTIYGLALLPDHLQF